MENQNITFTKEFWKYESNSGRKKGEYVYMVGCRGQYEERCHLMYTSSDYVITSRPRNQNSLHSSICSLVRQEQINPATASGEDKKAIDEVLELYKQQDDAEQAAVLKQQQQEDAFNQLPDIFREHVLNLTGRINNLYEDNAIGHNEIALFAAEEFGICTITLTGYYEDVPQLQEGDIDVFEKQIYNKTDDTNPLAATQYLFVKADSILGRVIIPTSIPESSYHGDLTKFHLGELKVIVGNQVFGKTEK